MARSKNVAPLPVIKTHCGLRLPPERHCLLSANYKLRSAEVQPKKLGKSALDRSAPKNKSIGSTILKRQSQANPSKTQTVTIPKPTFKVSANTNGNSNGAAGPSNQPPLTIASNHQINTHIKMEVEDEYSNDSRGIKRKRDDEDDFEYEEEFEPVA